MRKFSLDKDAEGFYGGFLHSVAAGCVITCNIHVGILLVAAARQLHIIRLTLFPSNLSHSETFVYRGAKWSLLK